MSVRQALLTLLAEGPAHGYHLRSEFEQRTGGAWPLNVGQVYTTLGRLERDGLVTPVEDADADQRQVTYAITPEGREAVDAWFAAPVSRDVPARDELAIKVALAVTLPGVDVTAMLQRQRSASIGALQDYTRLKRGAVPEERVDFAWSLVLDSLIFAAEAEVRWLDHCEARVRRAAAERRRVDISDTPIAVDLPQSEVRR